MFTKEEIARMKAIMEKRWEKASKAAEKRENHGNYFSTKYGKIMYAKALEIAEKSNCKVTKILIDKSEQSDSRYINFEFENGESYSIRFSDHTRKQYEVNGVYYDHQYDQDIRVTKFDNIDWETVIKDAVYNINSMNDN